jgi:hypothetical protein
LLQTDGKLPARARSSQRRKGLRGVLIGWFP